MATKRTPRISPSDREIGQKVTALIVAQGLNAKIVAQKAGIDVGNFYKTLGGKRGWSLGYLDKVVRVLGVSLQDLMGQPIFVPIVVQISALEDFPYPEIIKADEFDEFDKVELKGEGKGVMLTKLYAIELKDESMMPAFKAGTKFIVEKLSHDYIRDQDLVVCPDDSGRAKICRVLIGEEKIVLKSINSSVPDKTLPRNRLRACDKVVRVELS